MLFLRYLHLQQKRCGGSDGGSGGGARILAFKEMNPALIYKYATTTKTKNNLFIIK